MSISIALHDYWWQAWTGFVPLSKKTTDIVHKTYNLSHRPSTHVEDLKNPPPNVMFIWYEFPNGTITGFEVTYDKQFKTSGSPVLFL